MLHRFESFVTGITTCHKYIQRIKSAEMTELGLKGTHVMCIFFLHHNEQGLTASQLCQLCAEDKAAISRSLALLQERGYICAEDKKYRALIRLTTAGQELAARVDTLIERWVGLGGDGLSDEERETFYRVLEQIASNPGGVILDYGKNPFDFAEVLHYAESQTKRNGLDCDFDLMILKDGSPPQIYHHKK